MAEYKQDFLNDHDVHRNYHDTFVKYLGRSFYSSAIAGMKRIELRGITEIGSIGPPEYIINMNTRPELLMPDLGFFTDPVGRGTLIFCTRVIKRQWIFGAGKHNTNFYLVSLTRKQEMNKQYKAGLCQYFYEQPLLKQLDTRNLSLDDYFGQNVLVLRPEFAVLNGMLLHTDGTVGRLQYDKKTVIITNPDFDDSLMREAIETKLKWRVYANY